MVEEDRGGRVREGGIGRGWERREWKEGEGNKI
jgi:hypothetical protein